MVPGGHGSQANQDLVDFFHLGQQHPWKHVVDANQYSLARNSRWPDSPTSFVRATGARDHTQFRFLAQDRFQHWGRRWKVRRYIGHFTVKEWSTKASLLLRTLFKPQALPKKMSQSRLLEKGQGIKISSPMLRNPIFDFFASKRQSDGPIGGSQKFGRKSKS